MIRFCVSVFDIVGADVFGNESAVLIPCAEELEAVVVVSTVATAAAVAAIAESVDGGVFTTCVDT